MSARSASKTTATQATACNAAVTAFAPQPQRIPRLSPLEGLTLQRKCACGKSASGESECEECRKKQLQRHAAGPAPNRVPAVVHDVLQSPGEPLHTAARQALEPRFGHDFSQVRVHAGSRAGEAARAVNAQAFTVGSDIVFAPGEYQPASPAGHRLLAHELTHVVQQRGATGSPSSLSIAGPDSAAEREAESVAANLPRAGGMTPRIASAAPALHRQGFDVPKLEMDPKLQAEFLAMCAVGKGDPLLCAKMRLQLDPKMNGLKLRDPSEGPIISPDMMRAAQDAVNPPGGGTQAEPAAKEPKAPEAPKKSPWSSDILKGTIVEYKSPSAQFKVSIPDGVAAKFRAQLRDAQFLRIEIGVSTSAKFSASIKIDGVPIDLSSTVDPVGNKASVSLRVFGTTGKCATSVSPAVIAKVQDAGQKAEAAWKAFQTPAPKAPAAAPTSPPPTGISKDIQDVKKTVEGVVDQVQPEIELAKAIAAFVSAVEEVEKSKKAPCAKPSISFGATYQTPLQPDPNDPLNKPKVTFGLSGTF